MAAVHMGDLPYASCVLVVDDCEPVRTVMRRFVEASGYACEEASSGPEALERLATGGVALVLTDYEMPGGDGLSLIRAVVIGSNAVPIILVSGSASDDIADDALRAGARAVFPKPFDPSRLRAAIDGIVRGRPPAAASDSSPRRAP